MIFTGMVKSLSDRVPNQVDLLIKEIKNIQAQCQHLFSPIDQIILEESIIPGVYLANDHYGYTGVPSINTQCMYCSLQKKFLVTEKCPKCMGEMTKGSLGLREKYHGVADNYNASRIYYCKNCGFSLVADEWDQ